MNEGQPLRVLSMIHLFRPGFSGEAEAWLRMIPELRKQGLEVEIVTGTPGEPPDGREELIDGAVVHRVLAPPGVLWGQLRALIRLLARHRGRFDVALFHSPFHDAVFASCLLGHFLGWKTVYKMTLFKSDDCVTIRNTGRLGWLRVMSLRLADGFICMSEQLRRTADEVGLELPRLLIAPNALDVARFIPADESRRRSARLRLGIPETAKVVLFCGSIIRRKGVDILVEAWRTVSASVENALLLLVGPNHHDCGEDPEFSTAIERQIAGHSLEGSVRLEGLRTDMETYYAAADLFVLPSRAEGWPSVVNEAMASGLPCVVSSLDGASDEHVRSGEDGVIVRSENPGDYARQIMGLLTDVETARHIGGLARKRALEHFDVERVASLYAAFLREIVRRTSQRDATKEMVHPTLASSSSRSEDA